MESAAATAFEKSGHGGLVKDEKRAEADGDDDRRSRLDMVNKQVDRQKSSSPNTNREASSDSKEDEELEAAKAEMGEVIEENRKLKMYLERLTKEYQNLQMQFQDAHQEVLQKPSLDQSTSTVTRQEMLQEQEISLSLGRTVSSHNPKKDEKEKSLSTSKSKEDDHIKEGLSLGLDCKFEVVSKMETSTEHMPTPSPENSSEGTKEEEAGEILPPPGKTMKTTRTGDDEGLQQNNPKRARVSVRIRCDTPTMNDGCQWRKYGQKIAKGNPCPRAYYRCTIGPSCPVRKQVQRCSDDMSILITTYEGTHNHPLPVAATAMASTTSAAACMLLSGSTSSRPGGGLNATSTASTDLHGLNFYLSDNNKSNHQQFYLPNSSFSTSSNNAHPTITLDLTNSNPLSSTSSSAIYSHLNRFSSLSSPSPYPPRFSSSSSTSLNFSSSELTNSVPLSWGNNVLNYGSSKQQGNNYNNKTSQFGPFLGRHQNQESFYQNFMQKNSINQSQPQQQPPLPDTIAAATKAITSDPSFQSALAAALTSIMGGGANASQGAAENYSTQKFINWSNEQLSANNNSNSAYQPPPKVSNNCASSYLNKPTPSSTNSPAGSLMFLSSNALPFPKTKSASTSPGHSKEHVQLN